MTAAAPRDAPARRDVDIPRGRRGVFPDVDSAVQGGAPWPRSRTRRRRWRRASAGSTAMREAARAHVDELARLAVARDRLRPRRGQAEEEPAGDRKDARHRGAGAHRLVGRRRPDGRRAGQLRRHRLHHADHQPDRDHHQQRHRHGRGRQRGGVQRAPLRGAHVGVPGPPAQRGDRRGRRAGEPCSPASSGRRSRAPKALMRHPGVRLLVVTGGPGVVKAAMASGKKVIAAGPGNPPAVVDETADLDDRRGRTSSLGASIDNNILCTAEKEIVAVDVDRRRAAGTAGAQRAAWSSTNASCARWRRWCCSRRGGGVHANKDFVGKNAGRHRAPDRRHRGRRAAPAGRRRSTRSTRSCSWRC